MGGCFVFPRPFKNFLMIKEYAKLKMQRHEVVLVEITNIKSSKDLYKVPVVVKQWNSGILPFQIRELQESRNWLN